MTKKYILGIFIALSVPFTMVLASTPVLSVSGTGDGNNVQVTVSAADINTTISLYFNSTVDGTTHSQVIGTTGSTGAFSGTVSTNGLGINNGMPVFAIINGYQTNNVTWPYNTIGSSQVMFSQNNTNLAVGQNSTITVSGGNGNYYISNNSNSGAISASLSGNVLSVSGVGTGSSVITVCSSNSSTCGTTNVSTNNSTNSGLTFNPSALTLNPSQTGNVQVIGGNGPYVLTMLTGTGTLSYSYLGNVLSISGGDNGTRTLNICLTGTTVCGSLVVTINGAINNNSPIVSPSSLSINAGQTGSVQISGGNAPYSVSIVSGNSLSASILGNTLTVSGATSGATTLNVCSNSGACTSFVVNVGPTQQPNSALGFSLSLAINQTVLLGLTGGNGSAYYLQSAATYPILATISGNTLTVTGKAYGNSMVTVCQSGNGTCLPLTFVVNQASFPPYGVGGPFAFLNDLWFDMTNSQVSELQKFLIGENYLSSAVTGYFGPLTLAAVKRYQAANGIPATGYVGPLTRAQLNNN